MSALAGVLLGMVKAHLEIVRPKSPDLIPFTFNPTEYQLQKSNNFAEVPIPGLESPPLQFVRGGSEKLTFELLLDTSDKQTDVRDKYVNKLRGLAKLDKELHAPPIIKMVWGGDVFTGVMESINVTYTLFTAKGIPVRAKVSLGLKEYSSVAQQIIANPTQSPDFDKSWTVRRGDTLSSIAGAIYQDCSKWREIAKANGIEDPRAIAPGTELAIPKLR